MKNYLWALYTRIYSALFPSAAAEEKAIAPKADSSQHKESQIQEISAPAKTTAPAFSVSIPPDTPSNKAKELSKVEQLLSQAKNARGDKTELNTVLQQLQNEIAEHGYPSKNPSKDHIDRAMYDIARQLGATKTAFDILKKNQAFLETSAYFLAAYELATALKETIVAERALHKLITQTDCTDETLQYEWVKQIITKNSLSFIQKAKTICFEQISRPHNPQRLAEWYHLLAKLFIDEDIDQAINYNSIAIQLASCDIYVTQQLYFAERCVKTQQDAGPNILRQLCDIQATMPDTAWLMLLDHTLKDPSQEKYTLAALNKLKFNFSASLSLKDYLIIFDYFVRRQKPEEAFYQQVQNNIINQLLYLLIKEFQRLTTTESNDRKFRRKDLRAAQYTLQNLESFFISDDAYKTLMKQFDTLLPDIEQHAHPEGTSSETSIASSDSQSTHLSSGQTSPLNNSQSPAVELVLSQVIEEVTTTLPKNNLSTEQENIRDKILSNLTKPEYCPDAVWELLAKLNNIPKRGGGTYQAYLVGGAIRDAALDKKSIDFDIVIDDTIPPAVLQQTLGFSFSQNPDKPGLFIHSNQYYQIEVFSRKLKNLKQDAHNRIAHCNALYVRDKDTLLDPTNKGLESLASKRFTVSDVKLLRRHPYLLIKYALFSDGFNFTFEQELLQFIELARRDRNAFTQRKDFSSQELMRAFREYFSPARAQHTYQILLNHHILSVFFSHLSKPNPGKPASVTKWLNDKFATLVSYDPAYVLALFFTASMVLKAVIKNLPLQTSEEQSTCLRDTIKNSLFCDVLKPENNAFFNQIEEQLQPLLKELLPIYQKIAAKKQATLIAQTNHMGTAAAQIEYPPLPSVVNLAAGVGNFASAAWNTDAATLILRSRLSNQQTLQ